MGNNYFKLLLAQNSTSLMQSVVTDWNLSIMALSITPYITASIILQLLGNIPAGQGNLPGNAEISG